jgi:hypothetical protein
MDIIAAYREAGTATDVQGRDERAAPQAMKSW